MHTSHWRKSSYSGDGSNCIEIATDPTTIHIRDSKRTDDPHLTVAPSTWTTFISYAASPRRTP
ncbi:DUF397 domain-containing protein [Streptomyces sp. NBC_00576]|uniref:DUF397 domain-containing protein n=1 Tax=Streptomyces sp. NBC_00576 TaxID=2903665 RepID=UPI002E81CDAE|nr:DUF397 domain-containing protein [Streptomyces sp. NBC_00576]WUB74012.1 DUF397 domain-containing protein [Streptomyces sp. NBC_00576]